MSLKQPKSVFWNPPAVFGTLFIAILVSCVVFKANKTQNLYKFKICDSGGSCSRATTYTKVNGGVVFYYGEDKSEIVGNYSIKGR